MSLDMLKAIIPKKDYTPDTLTMNYKDFFILKKTKNKRYKISSIKLNRYGSTRRK